jgi:hypothetical protein
MRSGRADLGGKALSHAAEWERPDAPSAPLQIGQALVAIHGEQKPDVNTRLREAVLLAGGGRALPLSHQGRCPPGTQHS